MRKVSNFSTEASYNFTINNFSICSGLWDESNAQEAFNIRGDLKWSGNSKVVPTSVCSAACSPGSVRKFKDGRKDFLSVFYKQWIFSAQAQILLSEIQDSLKLALPYLTKRCLKYSLGREQSFDKGFRNQFSIFSEIGFENWQISA